MSEYVRGEGGSQILMLPDIRIQKLGKSGSKFQHGGGGYQKRPKKFRRLLWMAPISAGHKASPDLSYFELRYVLCEHNNSVGQGTTVFQPKVIIECRCIIYREKVQTCLPLCTSLMKCWSDFWLENFVGAKDFS